LLHWLVRVIGLWLSASMLWTFGLFIVLKTAFAISGPLLIENAGIRLSRFSKLIRWSWIGALSVDCHNTIRKMFFLSYPVMRLMIYLPKYEEKSKWIKGRAHTIPSLWYSKEQFESLVKFAGNKCFNVEPQGLPVLLGYSPLREETREMGQQRKLFRYVYSMVVAMGIICVLGRNAIVNYSYNAGNRAVRNHQLEEAVNYYQTAVSFKPAFAMAWHQLATIYWIQGKDKEAEEAWSRALSMRPDLVEAKVGLAYACLKRNDCGQAEKLLTNALRLSPTYVPGYLALADVYLKMKDYAKAKEFTKLVLQMDSRNDQAQRLLGQIEQVEGEK